jgi:hypothetical protein
VAVRTYEVDTGQVALVLACSDLYRLGFLDSSPWRTRCIQDSLEDLLVAAVQDDYLCTVDGGLERNQMVQLHVHSRSMALTVLLAATKRVDQHHLGLLVGEGATSMLACLQYQVEVDIQEVCSALWSLKSCSKL